MTNTFTICTSETGWGFKPRTVTDLTELVHATDDHVEVEVQLADGAVRKVRTIEVSETRDSFRLHLAEDGVGGSPRTAEHLAELLAAAAGRVEVEVQLPDGSVHKVYSVVLNPSTRDSFRLILNSGERRDRDDEQAGLMQLESAEEIQLV